jgi:hypothetical protein
MSCVHPIGRPPHDPGRDATAREECSDNDTQLVGAKSEVVSDVGRRDGDEELWEEANENRGRCNGG